MKNIQKGFFVPIIIIFIVLLTIGGIVYIYTYNRVEAPINIPEDISDIPVACTMDARQCPDGSWVGRTGPNCEFVCPVNITPSLPTESDINSTTITELMDLSLYIQDINYVENNSCSVTKKVTYKVPKTTAVADASLRILFGEELSAYGIYQSVNISNGVAKIILASDTNSEGRPISSLSSCESSHLLSVLNDTLKQYPSVQTVQLLSPNGIIQF